MKGRTRQRDLWVGLWVEDFDVRLRNRLSSISQNQNPNRLLRLRNANVATTEVIKLAKVGWLAAYDLEMENTMPNSISMTQKAVYFVAETRVIVLLV